MWTSLGNSQVRALSVPVMRWDNLFQDLEAQLETVLGDEDADLARDSERARHASLSLAECLVDEFANHHRLGPMQLLTGGIYLWITVDIGAIYVGNRS